MDKIYTINVYVIDRAADDGDDTNVTEWLVNKISQELPTTMHVDPDGRTLNLIGVGARG